MRIFYFISASFCSLIISCSLILLLDNYLIKKYQPTSLDIIATGEKGELGKGNEVLLDRIVVDGEQYNITIDESQNNWKPFSVHSAIYNKSNDTSTLTINLPKARDIQLYFSLYTVGGIAKIQERSGEITTFDSSSDDKSYSNHFYIYTVKGNEVKQNSLLLFIKYTFLFIIIYLLSMLLIYIIRNRKRHYWGEENFNNSLTTFWLFFCLTTSLLIICSSAYYPGNWSWDNLYQWGQATKMVPLDSGHPIIMTLGIRLLLKIYHSPLTILISLLLLSSCAISTFLSLCYKHGISLPLLVCIDIIFCFLPSTIVMETNILKDSYHSMFLVLLICFLAEILYDDKGFIHNFYYIIGLPLVLAGIYLFRRDAFIVYGGVVLAFLIYTIVKKNIRLLFIFLFSMVLIHGFNIITAPMVVIESGNRSMIQPMIKGFAKIIHEDKELSEETEELMNSILPIDSWKELYEPYNIDSIAFNDSFRKGIENNDNVSLRKLIKLYMVEFVRHPGLIVRDRLDGMNMLWQFGINTDEAMFYGYDGIMTFYTVGPSELGEVPDQNGKYMCNNTLSKIFRPYVEFSKNNEFVNLLVWRVSPSILLLFIFTLFVGKKSKKILLLSLPIYLRIATWMLVLNVSHYRYIYSIWLMVIVFMFLSFGLLRESQVSSKNKLPL